MNSPIYVSIIVPMYNVEKYIEKCLYSLMMQTLNEFEVIIVNDGSTDSSKELAINFIQQYNLTEKFILVDKKNGGLSDARNFGIPYAKGKYISFLDSDDYVDKNIYEDMYCAIKKCNAKIAECSYYLTYSKSESKVSINSNYASIKEYLLNGHVIAWNKMIDREWLLKTNVLFPKGLLYEDLFFFFGLVSNLSSIDEIVTLNKSYIHYVQRDTSISYSNNDKVKDVVVIYKRIISYLKQSNNFDSFHEEVEYKMVRNLFCSFLKRTKRIKERNKRLEIVKYFWNELKSVFPKWKKNKYLKRKGLVNIYLRLVSRPLLYLICII